jgi:hypothetical protein
MVKHWDLGKSMLSQEWVIGATLGANPGRLSDDRDGKRRAA